MNKAVTVALVLILSVALFGCTGTKQPEVQPNAENGKVEATKQQPESGTIVYKNADFGFSFSLPASWQGYQIVASQWEGFALDASGSRIPAETGPMLSIRHPQWTPQNPRQDVPILVFTTEQWTSLQAGVFHIGAAPINPSELGRTAKYVLALPARYNYAFPEGYEEVERILASHPLQATETQSR
jgi:hypothetical protein